MLAHIIFLLLLPFLRSFRPLPNSPLSPKPGWGVVIRTGIMYDVLPSFQHLLECSGTWPYHYLQDVRSSKRSHHHPCSRPSLFGDSGKRHIRQRQSFPVRSYWNWKRRIVSTIHVLDHTCLDIVESPYSSSPINSSSRFV